jgi:hypothetical protein
MSNFVTPIPIHLDKIKALLPPGSTVTEAKWNPKTNSVDLFWHNGKLQTKYLWPFEFTLAQLESGRLPEGAETREQMEARLVKETQARGDEARKAAEAKRAADLKAATDRAAQFAKANPNVVKPPAATNVLTDQPDQTKTKQREKLAGKAQGPVQAETRPKDHGAPRVLRARNAASLPADKRGKAAQRSNPPASSAPASAPVDGSEPATTGGVSTVNDRE